MTGRAARRRATLIADRLDRQAAAEIRDGTALDVVADRLVERFNRAIGGQTRDVADMLRLIGADRLNTLRRLQDSPVAPRSAR